MRDHSAPHPTWRQRIAGRRPAATIFALAIAIGLGCGKSDPKPSGESAAAARVELSEELDFTLATIDGEQLSLADALAKGPVILDFWATWCAPCKIAMPAWAALADEYASHGVQLWAVSWDHPNMVDRIGPYFEREGFTFPALLDSDKKVGRGLGVVNLPTTLLVSPTGEVVLNHVGFAQGDEREFEARLREILELTSND